MQVDFVGNYKIIKILNITVQNAYILSYNQLKERSAGDFFLKIASDIVRYYNDFSPFLRYNMSMKMFIMFRKGETQNDR